MKLTLVLEIVWANNVDLKQDFDEEKEPPRALKSLRVEDGVSKPIYSTSFSVPRSQRQVKRTKRCIKECYYVAYALTIGSGVEGLDDLSSFREAIALIDARKCG